MALSVHTAMVREQVAWWQDEEWTPEEIMRDAFGYPDFIAIDANWGDVRHNCFKFLYAESEQRRHERMVDAG